MLCTKVFWCIFVSLSVVYDLYDEVIEDVDMKQVCERSLCLYTRLFSALLRY